MILSDEKEWFECEPFVRRCIRKEGDVALGLKYDGACPDCGDSIQTVKARVPDHGTYHDALIGWCMDCKEIKAYAVFPDPSWDLYDRLPGDGGS